MTKLLGWSSGVDGLAEKTWTLACVLNMKNNYSVNTIVIMKFIRSFLVSINHWKSANTGTGKCVRGYGQNIGLFTYMTNFNLGKNHTSPNMKEIADWVFLSALDLKDESHLSKLFLIVFFFECFPNLIFFPTSLLFLLFHKLGIYSNNGYRIELFGSFE